MKENKCKNCINLKYALQETYKEIKELYNQLDDAKTLISVLKEEIKYIKNNNN